MEQAVAQGFIPSNGDDPQSVAGEIIRASFKDPSAGMNSDNKRAVSRAVNDHIAQLLENKDLFQQEIHDAAIAKIRANIDSASGFSQECKDKLRGLMIPECNRIISSDPEVNTYVESAVRSEVQSQIKSGIPGLLRKLLDVRDERIFRLIEKLVDQELASHFEPLIRLLVSQVAEQVKASEELWREHIREKVDKYSHRKVWDICENHINEEIVAAVSSHLDLANIVDGSFQSEEFRAICANSVMNKMRSRLRETLHLIVAEEETRFWEDAREGFETRVGASVAKFVKDESRRNELVDVMRDVVKPGVKTRDGHVYFVKGERYWKIGRAFDPEKRLSELTKSACPLTLFHAIKCSSMSAVESKLHRLWAKYRVNGEWFDIPDRVVRGWVGIKVITKKFNEWCLFDPRECLKEVPHAD